MIRNKLNLRKMVAIAACLAVSVTLFAQDIIIMKNGSEIQAIVQDVGIDDVKYKKFDNPSGPNYTLKKSEIFMIRYENGSKDVFNEIVTEVPTDKQQQSPLTELSYSRDNVWQNDVKIKPDQVRAIMSGNSAALEKYNTGRALHVTGQIFAYPGVFLLGWNAGTVISGGEINGVLVGLGLASSISGIIMLLAGKSQMKTSVNLYNSGLNNNATSYQINFGATQNGIGLCLQF